MCVKKFISFLVLALVLSVTAFAQSTRVKGRVTDAGSGEGIPFAAIYFKGTTIGVSSDMDGYYTIETRDEAAQILCADLLGYDHIEYKVNKSSFNEINFRLHLTNNSIAAATVKPDNSRMKRILAAIDANKPVNDPERRDGYECEIYNKMEIDLTNAEENLRNKLIRKNFGFVFDYMDTSVVSGTPYLPVMISETVSRHYHKKNPALDKEIIEASRISGLNDQNLLQQFTGSMLMKTNFYRNFITAFEVDIPSPISSNGDVYYNYYLIDSLNIDGRKTWKIRFHPKKLLATPVFDGEMAIDSEEYALQQIHVRLQKGSNVNWLRELIIDVENVRMDSLWFYKQDRMYVDICPVMSDSTKIPAFLGRRQLDYSKANFDVNLQNEVAQAQDNVTVRKDAGRKDDAYWDSVRPYQLSTKEQNIYKMVDEIKNVPIYKDMYTLISTMLVGYWEKGKIGYGPIGQVLSFNDLEKVRLQGGVRTTSDFSRKLRLTAYLGYGLDDKEFKGGGSAEIMFNNLPTRKLTISGKRDLIQLGHSTSAITDNNFFSSLFSRGGRRLSPVNEYSILYDHEFTPGLNTSFGFQSQRVFSNRYVPMWRPDGSWVQSVGATMARAKARLSWNETINRGAFNKTYIYTRYPVLSVDVIGSVKGLGRNEYSFLRTEARLDYRLRIPPAGHADIMLSAGRIVGHVPYPMLKLHEGNDTYFLDRDAFACMDFYEFASDTWVTFFYEHNFGGFFLGQVPLLRRMQLREVFTLKTAYGTLADRNNGIIGNPLSENAIMLFPEGMSDLRKPYVELGAGITNIFRLFRVDAVWRTTHRYREIGDTRIKADNLFSLNVGMELSF